MGTSDMIARFIQAELEEANGVLELQRSDLAQRFGCVPSQINYVMSTRFSRSTATSWNPGGAAGLHPHHPCPCGPANADDARHQLRGRYAGPGQRPAILSNLVQSQAVERNVAQTLLWAVSDNSLRSVPKDRRDDLRASIFKQVLIHLV